MEASSHVRCSHRRVMLEAVFTDEMHEALKILNLDDGLRSKRIQRIIRKLPFAH